MFGLNLSGLKGTVAIAAIAVAIALGADASFAQETEADTTRPTIVTEGDRQTLVLRSGTGGQEGTSTSSIPLSTEISVERRRQPYRNLRPSSNQFEDRGFLIGVVRF